MDMQHPYPALLSTAREAAAAAQDVITHYYQQQFDVDFKDDDSPVTVADVESERAIREAISKVFPDHGFYGEELGRADSDSDYVWLIDPIDGTKSFVRGYPMFSTQIALMHKGELILGLSNAPMVNAQAYAMKGQGAWLNDEPIQIQPCESLDRATLSIGNIGTLAGNAYRWGVLGELLQRVHRHRGYGDFLHYHMLASGKLDIIIESDVNVLDVAALSVIVQEAGGCMTTLEGEPVGLETSSVLAACCPALHEQLLQRFTLLA